MQLENLAFCKARTPATLRLDYTHFAIVREVAAFVRRRSPCLLQSTNACKSGFRLHALCYCQRSCHICKALYESMYEVILQLFFRRQCGISVNHAATVFWGVTSCSGASRLVPHQKCTTFWKNHWLPTSGCNIIHCWKISLMFMDRTVHGSASEPTGESWAKRGRG
jgi:hypothetical protein